MAYDLRVQPFSQSLLAEVRHFHCCKAGSQGPTILSLFVDKRNARAIAFYNRIGFQSLPDEGGEYMKMYLDLN